MALSSDNITLGKLPSGGGRLHGLWPKFRQSRGGVVGLAVALTLILTALGADILAPHDPLAQFGDYRLLPPAWSPGGDSRFILGTDPTGRDILSRLIHGARISLSIGLASVVLALSVGVLLGLLAGYFRGWVDAIVLRIVDIMMAFPTLLLALAVVAVLGPGLVNAMIAIAIVAIPQYLRITRAAVMAEMARDYVTASRVAGASPVRIMFVTILPNALAPIIVQATLGFSAAILDAAALGFLGLGAQPPIPEWGTMLADARDLFTRAWWVMTFPGLAILVTVLALNLMGDGLRDALDPRLK